MIDDVGYVYERENGSYIYYIFQNDTSQYFIPQISFFCWLLPKHQKV